METCTGHFGSLHHPKPAGIHKCLSLFTRAFGVGLQVHLSTHFVMGTKVKYKPHLLINNQLCKFWFVLLKLRRLAQKGLTHDNSSMVQYGSALSAGNPSHWLAQHPDHLSLP